MFDLDYDFDKWLANEKKVLFVTGLSGCGKSTLCKKLAKLNRVELIALDGYLNPLLRSLNQNSNEYNFRQSVYKEGIETLLQQHPDKRIIFEGVQVFWMDREKLKDHAVVVIKMSFIKSTLRAILRDFTWEHWQQYKHIAPWVHWNYNRILLNPMKKLIEELF